MAIGPATYQKVEEERYLALLRAANSIATSSDCNVASENMVRHLRDVTPFDYLHLVAFDKATLAPEWCVLHTNGRPLEISCKASVKLEDTPIQWAYESGEVLCISDWTQETRFPAHKAMLAEMGITSTCVLPLKRGDRRLGVLCLGRFYPNAYDEEELAFLGLVADQIGLAIDAAVNFYVSQRVKDQLKLVLELNNKVVSNLEFHEFLRATSASVREVMRCNAVAVMLADEDGKHLVVHALDYPDSRGIFNEGVLIPIEGTIPGDTFRTGKPMVVNRLDPAEIPAEMYRKATAEGLKSFCDVPLLSKNRLLGVLAVARREEDTFDEDEVAFLTQVANQVAIGVENALAYSEIADLKDRLAQEKLYLEDEIRGEMDFDGIVGQSSALRHVLQLVETVAPSDSTVLLLGETGTGKELIARAIHERSRRKDRTFVKLNCAAIPTGLLESELFGHEKGAFTGAISQKVGRMELADHGTLFLDEVGDIPVEIQPKLLRALQEREFERLGSTQTRKVDIRLVAATNRDLEKMIASREFRSDLFYRLNVFPIRIPPLRERREDIPLLVGFFVQKFAKRMQKKIDSVPMAVMKGLTAWEWPGNIRELENFIERAVILTRGKSLQAPLSELRKPSAETQPTAAERPASRDDIARIVKETIRTLTDKKDVPDDELTRKQREEIVRALTESKGRVGGAGGAAARMGINRTTLLARIRKLGIDPRQYG